jgi:hypothetical protein
MGVDSGWVLLAAFVPCALAIAWTWWSYRRERGVWNQQSRVAAATVRTLAWITWAIVLLGPGLARVDQRELKPPVVVLRDSSLSMSLAGNSTTDQSAVSRSELVSKFITHDAANAWRALSKRASLRVLDFDLETHSAGQDANSPTESVKPQANSSKPESRDGDFWPPWTADGRGTDIAQALETALAGESPIAILLFSDGQHTVRSDPREAAREAGERGIPIIAVGMGQTHRTLSSRVAGVYVRPQVWRDEPFEVEVIVASQSSEKGSLNVTLWRRPREDVESPEESPASTYEKVASATLALDESGEQRIHRQVFQQQIETVGRYVYEARLELEGESRYAPDDTRRESLPVRVLERDRLRVLAIAGEPSWEYRQIERWLTRDSGYESSCWLQSADENRPASGTRPLPAFPNSAEELLWYDVVLLLDPDPTRLPPEFGTWLRQFLVEHGGGVLYQPGYRHGAEWNSLPPGDTLLDVWPVEFAEAAELELATRLGPALRSWPVQAAAGQQDHPLVRDLPFGDTDSPANTMEVYWSFPATRARPAARVLLEHGDPATRTSRGNRPLLATGRFGAAHVAYLGFPSTWRVAAPTHRATSRERFWRGMIEFLGEGRAWEGHRRGWLQADRERLEVGESTVLTARIQETLEEPASLPSVEVQVREGAEQLERISLLPKPGEAGVFEGRWTAPRPGVFELEFELPSSTPEPEKIRTTIVGELPQVETRAPWLDEALLGDLSRLSGGRYFPWERLQEALAAVPDQREVAIVRHSPRPLWDNGWVLSAFVGLLAAEWLVRKRHRAV